MWFSKPVADIASKCSLKDTLRIILDTLAWLLVCITGLVRDCWVHPGKCSQKRKQADALDFSELLPDGRPRHAAKFAKFVKLQVERHCDKQELIYKVSRALRPPRVKLPSAFTNNGAVLSATQCFQHICNRLVEQCKLSENITSSRK